MNSIRPFSGTTILTIGLLLGVTGCGSKETVVSVSGTITRNGQPIPGLVVSFVPEAATETGVSTGETDDSGKYSLKVVNSGARGAVVGKHKVWVSLPREPYVEKDPNNEMDKEERAKAKKQKKAPPSAQLQADLAEILKKYGRLPDSPLTVEVKDGSPIDLKLD